MTLAKTISIDQNSHTLWDTVPKLDALAAHGFDCTHCVEDVDIAFTRHGVRDVDEAPLSLARERYYRGGASDWGAALFYSDFLGRLPLDVRDLEPYTGWSTAALSRRLECTVDDLYDRYSPSDNWQLVGSSYADLAGRYHRVIGDVKSAEVAEQVTQLLTHARDDLVACFPESAARGRIDRWFDREESLVTGLLAENREDSLATLYRKWLAARVPRNVAVSLTSGQFSIRAGDTPAIRLMHTLVSRYDEWVEAYNEAVAETAVGLNPIRSNSGDLPMAAVFRDGDRWKRADLTLDRGSLRCGDHRWPLRATPDVLPLDDMAADGVAALVGKALLLVLQVRLPAGGTALALPYQGSLYMPAAHALEEKLRARGVLSGDLLPVYRVRFRFFDLWEGCSTGVCPPAHVRRALGIESASAGDLAGAIESGQADARKTLQRLKDETTRQETVDRRFPHIANERDELQEKRRRLARTPEGRVASSEIWERVKELERNLLEKQVEWILDQMHLLDLHYYDSRGALLPWAVALGGQAFYERMIEQAEIRVEQT